MPTPLPTNPPFDVLFLAGTDIGNTFVFDDVVSVGNSGQFTENATSLVMASGGAVDTTDLQLYLEVPVPAPFTFEFIVTFDALPANFTDLTTEHVYLGASNTGGPTFGLFVSKVGLAYTGSIRHDGSGNMLIDSAVQALPNSQNYITLGEQTTIRVAVDLTTGAAYVYVTPTAQISMIGHQLRYVLPALDGNKLVANPPNQVQFSVLGLAGRPAQMTMWEVAVGHGLLIPVVQPVADAGTDQAVRTCSIVRLDGERSIDPQGGSLTFLWQLVDAPLGSQFLFDGHDGQTFPLGPPTGFTDKFYSASLGVLDGTTPIVLGTDVIVVAGNSYVVTGKGTDINGFYAQIGADDFPDNLPALTSFKFLPQRGISDRTSMVASFFPDIPGLYKFNLTVSNGALASAPAETVVNVTTSFLPRGIIPDMKFLWGYLSDFWKLIEDPERIEVFWGALAQCIATELLTLWQIDYSKSLRDIQRSFQRRWLHYDLALNEQANLIEFSTIRAVFGGVESTDIATAGIAGVAGNHLDLQLATQDLPVVVPFTGSGLLTAQEIADRINAIVPTVDSRFIARVIPNKLGTGSRIRLDAPFVFSVVSTSTVTIFTGVNAPAHGTHGAVVGSNTYRVGHSLAQVPWQPGDYLIVDDGVYRIVNVVDNPADVYPFQRVVLQDPIPSTAGTHWVISGQIVSQSLDFYAGMVEAGDVATVEIIDTTTNQIGFVQIPVLGASSFSPKILGVDPSSVAQYMIDPRYEVFFTKVVRRQYTPIDPLVQDVPYLQQMINNTDDTQVLRRNLDFFIDTFRGSPCVRFAVDANPDLDVWEGGLPPDRMWAEITYLDNSPRIEANFGIPADFTLDDLSKLPPNVDYLSTVRGLWYAYLRGPTVANLRAGTQILIGLPFAEETGVIQEIRSDFSSTTGRILIRDTINAEIVRSYTYPASLAIDINPTTGLPYAVGDTVQQFAPLVQGVDVLDYIKDPTWFAGLLQQGSFWEIDKYFTFLVRTDSTAFSLTALLFVQSFIRRVKPTYTQPIFVVRANVAEADVVVTDEIDLSGSLQLNDGPWMEVPGAGMWDDPKPSGGGWWNRYDANSFTSSLTFPTPTLPVPWGFDKGLIKPEHPVFAILTGTTAAPGDLPPWNALGVTHASLFTSVMAVFSTHLLTAIPAGSIGYSFGTTPATATGTATLLNVDINGTNNGGGSVNYTLEIWKNGTLALTKTITNGPTAGEVNQRFTVSLAVTTGDTMEARIRTSSSSDVEVHIHDILIVLGIGVVWDSVGGAPAGTYKYYRSM